MYVWDPSRIDSLHVLQAFTQASVDTSHSTSTAPTAYCPTDDADLCYDTAPAGSVAVTNRVSLSGITQDEYKSTLKEVCERAYGKEIGVYTATYTATHGSWTEVTSLLSSTFTGTTSTGTTTASHRRSTSTSTSTGASFDVDFRAVADSTLAAQAVTNSASLTASKLQAAIAAAATSLSYSGTVPTVVTVGLVPDSGSSSNTGVIVACSIIGGLAVFIMIGTIYWYVTHKAPEPAAAEADVGIVGTTLDPKHESIKNRECC